TVNWKTNNGYVAVLASNGCGNTGKTTYQVTIGCAPLASNDVRASSIHVSPNPVSSSAQISFSANKEAKYVIELTDKTGRLLQRNEIIANQGENSLNIDLSRYVNGSYFVNVIGEDQRRTAQVMKSN